MTSEAPMERPVTSRSRRSHAMDPVAATAAYGAGYEAYERPRTSKGRRSEPAPVDATPPAEDDPYERPKTSHGRRPIVIPSGSHHSETGAEFYNPGKERRKSTVDILKLDDNSASTPASKTNTTVVNTGVRRPHQKKTETTLDMDVRGYSVQDASFRGSQRSQPMRARHDITTEYSPNPTQTFGYEGTERPRTSHGRRQRAAASQQPQQASDSNYGQTSDPFSNHPYDQPAEPSDYPSEPYQTPSDHSSQPYQHSDNYGSSERPNSRRSSVPSGPSSYNLTPSPPPYSPTGGSSYPRPARKSFSGPSSQEYHSAYLPPSTPSYTSRPSSAASLSKYTVLPRIGVKVSPRSLESVSVSEEKGSSDILTLADGGQSLNLGDGENVSPSPKEQKKSVPSGKNSRDGHSTSSTKPGKVENISAKPTTNVMKPAQTATNPQTSTAPAKSILKKSSDATKGKIVASPKGSPESLLKPLKRNVKLPPEPKGKEAKILLAVKLHNGQRVQRHFRPTETLNTVLNFAEISAKVDYGGHELVCNAPRKTFSNLGMQIKDSGLEDKTVLHLQYPDE